MNIDDKVKEKEKSGTLDGDMKTACEEYFSHNDYSYLKKWYDGMSYKPRQKKSGESRKKSANASGYGDGKKIPDGQRHTAIIAYLGEMMNRLARYANDGEIVALCMQWAKDNFDLSVPLKSGWDGLRKELMRTAASFRLAYEKEQAEGSDTDWTYCMRAWHLEHPNEVFDGNWKEVKAAGDRKREKSPPDKKNRTSIGKSTLIVKPMSAYEVILTEFLFFPYFPLKLCIIAAYPGSGKTFIACMIAAAVSLGTNLYNCKNQLPNRNKVIYFSSEDGYADTIGVRLRECHADMSNILAVEFDDNDTLDFTDGRLEDLIKQEQPALMIFDTLQNFIGNVNMNAANETTAKMRALVRLADQYKCCILLIAHFNKNEMGSAITRTIGSTDIVGKCRSYMCVGNASNDDKTKFLSHEKCNVAPLGDTLLFEITPDRGGITFTGTSQLKADEYAMRRRLKGKPSPELDSVEDFIIKNMPNGKRESKEIERLCSVNGFSNATVKRAKKALGIESVREGKSFQGAKWYWKKPKGGFYGVDGMEPIDYSVDPELTSFISGGSDQGEENDDSN